MSCEMTQKDRRMYFIRMLIPMTIVSGVYSMQLSPLALYVTKLGGTAGVVGLIGGINFIIGMIARPFAGYLSDEAGRKKVYLFGIAAYIIATIGYVISPNIVTLIVSRAISGLGVTCTTTAQYAMVPDLYPDNMVTCFRVMALLQGAVGLFAPALGIYLGQTLGYRPMFAITLVLFIIAAIFGCFINYEKKYSHERIKKEKTAFPKFSELFEKSVICPSICIMLHGVAYIVVFNFIATYGQTMGIQNIGFFFTLNGIASVVAPLLLVKVTGQKIRNGVFYIGSIVFIATEVVIAFATNANMLYLGGVLLAVGYTITQPILNEIALASAPENRKGAASGTFQMFWDFGFGAGSAAMGVVATKVGYSNMYLIAAAIVVLIMIIFAVKLAKVKSEEKAAE